jgi:hypothetical protein
MQSRLLLLLVVLVSFSRKFTLSSMIRLSVAVDGRQVIFFKPTVLTSYQ